MNLTLIEIDPVVYNFATRYFGVDDVRAGEVVLEDAVAWVDRQEARGQVSSALQKSLNCDADSVSDSSITSCTTW